MTMSELEEETPVKATSITKIGPSKIDQKITFYYNDPTQIYYSYVKNDLLDDMLEDISESMQAYLSQDIFKINNQDVPLVLEETEIDFYKGKKNKPYLLFSIVNGSDFELVNGENTIVLEAEKEILDYEIVSTWKLPGKILEIVSPLKHKITGFQVVFSASQGDEIGGFEQYSFQYHVKKSKKNN